MCATGVHARGARSAPKLTRQTAVGNGLLNALPFASSNWTDLDAHAQTLRAAARVTCSVCADETVQAQCSACASLLLQQPCATM
jgi:hypothetical protein